MPATRLGTPLQQAPLLVSQFQRPQLQARASKTAQLKTNQVAEEEEEEE